MWLPGPDLALRPSSKRVYSSCVWVLPNSSMLLQNCVWDPWRAFGHIILKEWIWPFPSLHSDQQRVEARLLSSCMCWCSPILLCFCRIVFGTHVLEIRSQSSQRWKQRCCNICRLFAAFMCIIDRQHVDNAECCRPDEPHCGRINSQHILLFQPVIGFFYTNHHLPLAPI